MVGPYIFHLTRPKLVSLAFKGTVAKNVVGTSNYGKYAGDFRCPDAFQDQREMAVSLMESMNKMQRLHMNFGANIAKPISQEEWWFKVVRNMFHAVGWKYFERVNHPSVLESPEFEAIEARAKRISEVVDEELIGSNFDSVLRRVMDDFHHPPNWHVYPEVPGAIDLIKKMGIKVGVTSNFDNKLESIIEGCFCHSGSLASRLDFVVGSRSTGVMKPHQQIYHKAAQMAEVSPDNMIHIGEHVENDFFGPAVCGAGSLLMHRRTHTQSVSERLNHLQTDRVVTDLDEVAKIMDDLPELTDSPNSDESEETKWV